MMKTEKQDNSSNKNLQEIAGQHEALQTMFGLNKSVENRGVFAPVEKKSSVRAIIVIAVSLAIVAGCVAMWAWGQRAIRRQEEARVIAKKQQELEAEKLRRNQIEYADIAFLDSFPPNVDISMDGKKLYARSQNGSYTELRARESTWIQNLAVKETTVRIVLQVESYRIETSLIVHLLESLGRHRYKLTLVVGSAGGFGKPFHLSPP